jgi:type I restriction enzyme R subunit
MRRILRPAVKKINKKELSETDICDKFITPAIKDAGWDPDEADQAGGDSHSGPHRCQGQYVSRNKKKKKFADYVLSCQPGVPIAVVEAKDNNHTVSHGMQQALGYADILKVPSAYSSNGDAFASHNKVPADGEDDRNPISPRPVSPPRTILWQRYKTYRGIEDTQEGLLLEPYHSDSSGKEPRYYQVEAINRVIEAVAQGAAAGPAGHGHRHRQDLHHLPDYLAALEGPGRQARPVPGGPQYPGRPDPGQ